MKTGVVQTGLCLLVAGMMAGVNFRATAQNVWLELGPAARGAMHFKITGSSYVQTLGHHAAPAPLASPASVGPRYDWADREYDNGYVRLDEGTLNPDAVGGPGNTWNWAYDQSAQFNSVNSANNTLTYSKQGDVGYTTLLDAVASGRDEALGAGLQAVGGWNIRQHGRWSVDLAFGFHGVWDICSKWRGSTYRERTSYLTVADTYDVAATVDPEAGFPLPRTQPGGYTGTYSDPGPVFTNVPMSRTTTDTPVSTAENRLEFNFELDYLEFTFAPRFRFTASEKISLHLSPKIGVGILEIEADRRERFIQTPAGGGAPTTLESWYDQRRQRGVQFIAGAQAGADFDLGNNYYVGIFGGYTWIACDTDFALGPNRIAVDGSGYSAGVVIGRRY